MTTLEQTPGPEAQPPLPAAQVAAEAPISPPRNAGRDIFAQMGVPQSALADLDRSVGRSRTAADSAIATLARTQVMRTDAVDRMQQIERPVAPELTDIPEAPQEDARSNLRVFGQFLPVLAMLGGAVNRNSATAALRAGAAAMRAAESNDAAALEQAQQQWQQNVEATLQQNRISIERFNAAQGLYQTDINAGLAELNAIAAQEQNPVLQAQVAAGDLGAITDLFQARTSAYSAVQSAFAEQQRINLERQRLSQTPPENFDDVARLRDQYTRATADISTIESNYAQIQGLAERAGDAAVQGPADIGLIFSYMKMLDPGSTVREGEYATAQNAGAVPDNITAMYNRLIDGGRLSPRVRDEFVESAGVIASRAQERRTALDSQYRGIAERYNFNPADVLTGAGAGTGAAAPAPATTTVPEGAIAYLRRHPETAPQFEQMFPGHNAAQYLRPGPDQ